MSTSPATTASTAAFRPGRSSLAEVKTRPLRLPASMSTRHVATAATNVHGGDWQLRRVEVAADDQEWMPVHDPRLR